MDELTALLEKSGGVFTTRQAAAVGVRRKTLTRAIGAGHIDRIWRGVYAAPDPERQPSETFRLRVIGALRRRWRTDAASHHAALAMYRVSVHGVSLTRVDVDSHTRVHRRHGRLWVHPWTLGTGRHDVEGVGVVDIGMACVQVAMAFGFEPGVVAMDAAMHAGQVTRQQLEAALGRCWEHEGIETARAAVNTANGLIESVGESRTRIVFLHNGIEYRPQVNIRDRIGFIGRVDFLVEGRLVVEFDGEIKYSGGDRDEILAAQDVREARLVARGLRVLRLKWTDLDDPDQVVRRVRAELVLTAS